MSADSKSLGAFSNWMRRLEKHNDTHAVKSMVGEFNLPCLTHMLHWSPPAGLSFSELQRNDADETVRIQVVITTRPRGWAHLNLTWITIFPRWSYCGFWDTFSLYAISTVWIMIFGRPSSFIVITLDISGAESLEMKQPTNAINISPASGACYWVEPSTEMWLSFSQILLS